MTPEELAAAAPAAPPVEEHASLKAFEPGCFAVPFELLPREVKAQRQMYGMGGAGLEFKSVATEIKATPAKRQVELWIAAFGNVDDGDDTIPFGAAEKSIKEDGPTGQNLIKHFWNHSMLLGPARAVEQHKAGILMVGLVDDDPSLDRYLKHAESGAASHGSIGYEVIRASKKVVAGKTVRSLDEIKLYEGSLVIWPMNRAATLESVKARRFGEKALERKGLWDFVSVVTALAELNSALRTLGYLQTSEWASLTPEEAAAIQVFLDMLVVPDGEATPSPLQAVIEAVTTLNAGTKSLRERLEIKPQATASNDLAGATAGAKALAAGLRQILGR